MRRVLRTAAVLLVLAGVPATVAFAQAPAAQDEFVPISELPPQEQLPAAPLLVGAYVFVVAVLFAYIYSVAGRLSAVQRDLTRLEGEQTRRGPS
jgi:hypothetical protein